MALSGSNFEIFVPTGAKHRTDSGEIWHERVLLHAIFHPIGAGVAMWGPKIDNFTKLVQNFLIQIPLEHIPCTIFMKFSGIVGSFICMGLYIKIWENFTHSKDFSFMDV